MRKELAVNPYSSMALVKGAAEAVWPCPYQYRRLSKGSFWIKDLAMRWREHLKSEAKRTKREERNDFGKKKRSRHEDGEV